MKRKLNFLFAFLFAVFFSLFGFVSCKKEETTPPVVIRVDEPVSAETTLLDYMTDLQAQGEFTFTMQNGMITGFNGTQNAGGWYWMLYTSDEANANEQWGVYEYEGQRLASAVFGAETLVIKQGKLYVWVYQSF